MNGHRTCLNMMCKGLITRRFSFPVLVVLKCMLVLILYICTEYILYDCTKYQTLNAQCLLCSSMLASSLSTTYQRSAAVESTPSHPSPSLCYVLFNIPFSYCFSPFHFFPPLPSHSSHYSLGSTFKWENDGKRGGAGRSRVTWSTHASFNLESNFTGTHLRHHKRHP